MRKFFIYGSDYTKLNFDVLASAYHTFQGVSQYTSLKKSSDFFEKIGIPLFRIVLDSIQDKSTTSPFNAMRGKGVWTMQWSDEDISCIEGKFDSFCKTVLRNFARDWYRAKQRHHATEVLFSELPNGQLFEPIHNDPDLPVGTIPVR